MSEACPNAAGSQSLLDALRAARSGVLHAFPTASTSIASWTKCAKTRGGGKSSDRTAPANRFLLATLIPGHRADGKASPTRRAARRPATIAA